jgi:hypothetical protein
MVQRCPICATELPSEPRYPNKLCGRCSALARDEHGRQLRFRNETLLAAGFIAEVDDHGVWRPRESGDCWVNGTLCIAGEHRFGGIVTQAVKE